MTKNIKELLQKCGVKAELVEEICAAIDDSARAIREGLEKEYKDKLDKAKKVCIEETERFKVDLARRLQIFCEAKVQAIEGQIARQSAIKESAATATLQTIQDLLAGIQPDGDKDLRESVTKLNNKIKTLQEEVKKARDVAKRQTAVAEKVLQRNRVLEEQARGTGVVTEGRTNPGQPAKPGKQPQRLDGSRSGGQAITTRRTLVENQQNRPPADKRPSHVTQGAGSELSPDNIAAHMDEEP